MNELVVSADSHVMEPVDLWKKRVPEKYRDAAPLFPPHKMGVGFQQREGGHDPHARIKEMEVDGLSAEVLYPTLLLGMFSQTDAGLQEACFRAYNDWLIEYSSVNPERLIGIAAIAAYDIDHAVTELERCRKNGLRGALLWQAPHPDLPFTSDHYERLWAAAQDLETPVSMHILTGHSYHSRERKEREHYRGSVNLKLLDAINAIYDFIFYGALERYPRLKIVTVENEAGWMPFIVQQWDYYYRRFRETKRVPMTKLPSEYVRAQVFSCFFNDAVCGHNLTWWGEDNVMWSNDYPHWNSTWPNSRQVIQRHLGHLPAETQRKVLAGNVCRLYGLDMAALPKDIAQTAAA